MKMIGRIIDGLLAIIFLVMSAWAVFGDLALDNNTLTFLVAWAMMVIWSDKALRKEKK